MTESLKCLRMVPNILFLVLITTSCGSQDRGSSGNAQVLDSAGITIVVSSTPSWDNRAGWALDTTSGVVLGVDGDEKGQLWQVRGVTRLSDGRIAVLNAGSGQIKYFDSRGRLLQTAGGIGGGPGEFQYPIAFSRSFGDTLVVLDRDGTGVLFDPHGSPVLELPFRRAEVEMENPESFTFDAVFPDGTILGRRRRQEGPRIPGSGWFRPTIHVERRNGESETLAEFGDFGEIQQEILDIGDRNLPIVPPFSRTTSVSYGGPESRVIIGDNDRFELQIFNLDGDLVQLLRRDYRQPPITSPEVEAWKERQRNSPWTQGQLPMLERGWAEMGIPETKPAFGTALGISTHGYPWVAEYTDPPVRPRRLFMFSPEGFFLGDLMVPDGLGADPWNVEIGPDYFLGVFLDEYDVETVRLYPIVTQ